MQNKSIKNSENWQNKNQMEKNKSANILKNAEQCAKQIREKWLEKIKNTDLKDTI